MNKEQPIGIFDSGLGGLSVYKELKRLDRFIVELKRLRKELERSSTPQSLWIARPYLRSQPRKLSLRRFWKLRKSWRKVYLTIKKSYFSDESGRI